MLKINDKIIDSNHFAYNGCHKIYLLEGLEQIREAQELGYEIYWITDLEDIWNKSCPLRFIEKWDLSETIVEQGEEAIIENIIELE